ncbi:HNH endonuclease [Ochrobactrum sp. A-1]|uniref:HNH endonuclease n=1 Tax=Ochrobactrum sp. A-1 TaxID=2920940 RepID=UPI001F0B248E
MRQDVDTSILRDILHYDADTGILFWKQRPSKYFSDTPTRNKEGHAKWWNGRFAGKRACKSDGHRGYLRVSIFREEYPAHRVIWAMVHGEWSTKSIDHIDGDKANNRTSNLREATTAENNKNRAPHGKSQYRGVSWRTRQNCWVSAIKTDGKVSFLGCFKEEIEAAKAYDRAAIIQHGEFARTNFPKADYEARILSALEPSAPDMGNPITDKTVKMVLAEAIAQVWYQTRDCDVEEIDRIIAHLNRNGLLIVGIQRFKMMADAIQSAAAYLALSQPNSAEKLIADLDAALKTEVGNPATEPSAARDLAGLPFWKCDACGNFVGCHHKTKQRTAPLGCIPTPEIKEARSHIHRILDPLWKSGRFSRRELYSKIANSLGIKEYHTAELRSVEQARDAYRAILEISAWPTSLRVSPS